MATCNAILCVYQSGIRNKDSLWRHPQETLFQEPPSRFAMQDTNPGLDNRQLKTTSPTGRLLTWWLGYTSVSATTTFSLLVATNTTTSAISSGVKGSHPLCHVSHPIPPFSQKK